MPRTGKKVVALADREKEKCEREMNLFAEAMAKASPSPEARAKASPSPEARAVVGAELAAKPDEWRRHGDLGAEAFELAFEKFWLGYYTKASVKHGADLLREEMGHAEASPAERVLIEHAVLCHVWLGMAEHLYSRNTEGSYNIRQAEHFEKRLTLAQKRFTRAVETLAKVRALLARAEVARADAERAKVRGPVALKAAG